jgi:hypothetical protein
MTEQTIVLPCAVVEALVDPEQHAYIHEEWGACRYCEGPDARTRVLDTSEYPHSSDCPVRVVQEALREQANA